MNKSEKPKVEQVNMNLNPGNEHERRVLNYIEKKKEEEPGRKKKAILLNLILKCLDLVDEVA